MTFIQAYLKALNERLPQYAPCPESVAREIATTNKTLTQAMRKACEEVKIPATMQAIKERIQQDDRTNTMGL